jgi:hypothetical protein
VIKAQLGSQGKWLAAACAPGCWEQNLFFHADVFKQAGTKFGIRSTVDVAWGSDSVLQQSIEPRMIVGKKTAKLSRHQVLLRGRVTISMMMPFQVEQRHLPEIIPHLLVNSTVIVRYQQGSPFAVSYPMVIYAYCDSPRRYHCWFWPSRQFYRASSPEA